MEYRDKKGDTKNCHHRAYELNGGAAQAAGRWACAFPKIAFPLSLTESKTVPLGAWRERIKKRNTILWTKACSLQ